MIAFEIILMQPFCYLTPRPNDYQTQVTYVVFGPMGDEAVKTVYAVCINGGID